MTSTSPLSIQLLGPFQVHIHGEPMPRVRTRSVEWLLALLVLRHGRAVDRSWLAGTLWPDSEESRALHNLRDNLVHLRRALGSESARLQSPTRDTLTLDLEGADADVLRFDQGMKRGEEEALCGAVELYAGPLLEGCLEEWVFPERASREQACLQALEMLAEAAEKRQERGQAQTLLRRAEGMDPLRDSIRRSLMRVLAADGDAPAALHCYREYRVLLRGQMGIEPDAETVELYQQIRRQAQQPAASPQQETRPSPDSSSLSKERSAVPAPSPAALPHPITALIGREEEIAEIAEALARARLVTLVGGGGVGKTRLSIEVAAGIDANTAQKVAFVALASLADPSLLPTFVVSALGIGKAASPDPALLMQGLIAWLAGREILLVLDNCEHLIEKTASLALELLERCPDLRILATSRQRLGLAGEIVWRVPSLPVPEVGLLPDALSEAVSAALNFPGIRLFFERACSAQREFQPRSREEVEAICRICRQLDGIPLAIELAAARVASLTVEDIAGRLDQRFRLLTGGSRAALPLQQTLRSLIDWSYDLLSAQERTLLGRLSVFTAGWTLEAAEEICVGGAVEEWEMLDLLTGLADKSLVLAEPQGASVRYRLLETVRLYGCERLEAAGERAEVQRRHSEFFLHMSEEAEARAETVGQMDLILRLGGEHDNLRTALEGSLHPLRFCAALLSFWQMRGHLSEGRTWCARALAREEAQAGTLERAKVLHVAGTLANLQGDYTVAQSSHEANLSIVRERGDRSGIAAALNGLGNVVFNQGDTVAARAYYAESLVLQRELGNRKGIGSALHNLGNVARSQGDYVAAQDCYAKSLTLFREAGNRGSAANALSNLGRVAAHQGDYAAARAYYEESLRLYREIGNRTGIAGALIVLGNLAYEQGDHSPARAYYEECLILYREFGERSGIGAALNNLGGVASHQGDYIAARGYYEESLRLFREIGHRPFLANTLHGLGSVMFQQGDQAMARTCHDESLRLQEEIGDRYGIAHSLAAISNMAVRADRPARAVLLWGAAEALREEIGSPLSAGEREHRDRDVAETRRMLGEEAFAAAWESGRTLTLKQAVRCALSEADA